MKTCCAGPCALATLVLWLGSEPACGMGASPGGRWGVPVQGSKGLERWDGFKHRQWLYPPVWG